MLSMLPPRHPASPVVSLRTCERQTPPLVSLRTCERQNGPRAPRVISGSLMPKERLLLKNEK